MKSVSLAEANPLLAEEWHPTKNGDLTPFIVAAHSNKKVWWLGKCGHEWEAVINSRYSGSGCPYCSNHRLLQGFNDLATINPKLASEWHPTKNGSLFPNQVLSGTSKKVWWKCKYGHEWQAVVASRINGTGCPICFQKRKTSFPEQAIYYYLHKIFPDTVNRDNSLFDNKMELDIYVPSISTGIEYDGAYWHKTDTESREKKKYSLCQEKGIKLIRIKENNSSKSNKNCDELIISCQAPSFKQIDEVIYLVLSSLKVVPDFSINCKFDEDKIYSEYLFGVENSSLAIMNPALAKEWHPYKNLNLKPEMFTCSSGKSVWWLCEQKHEWKAIIAHRFRGVGCPYCTGQKRIHGLNDLKTTNPDLAAEWHPTKNGKTTPESVGPYSNKRVWWLGKCGHEWEDIISQRSSGCGCPYCSSHRVLFGFNDLASINPRLAKEWHPTKNGSLTPSNVTLYSQKKVWWLGECGHEWQATINRRSNGSHCPYCVNRKVLPGFNDLETLNPELASEWHPTKNEGLTPKMFVPNCGKSVWWFGKCGHEWKTRIIHRSNGHGCPKCANLSKQKSSNKIKSGRQDN